MLELEKNLIRRLGDAGWVLFWLPRLHTVSKILSIQAPPYMKEAHLLIKKITRDIESYHGKQKRELDKRKDLPLTNPKHLGRHQYMQALGVLNAKKGAQRPNFVQDNILIAAQGTERNLIYDAFETGMESYATGDYTPANMERFLRQYVEQDNPPQAGETLAALYHEVRRFVRHKRRDWVPGEMGYINDFIRNVKMHFKRIGRIGFWDGVNYHANLSGGEAPSVDSEKKASAKCLNPEDILKIMELFCFKFESHAEFPQSRKQYDRLKQIIVANYDFDSQIRTRQRSDGTLEEIYIKPAISTIKTR